MLCLEKGTNLLLLKIQRLQPTVFDIGCICHLANLCVHHAVKPQPIKIDDMLVDIYYHFQHSAKRREEFEENKEFTDTEPHQFLKHAITRWLSLEKFVSRETYINVLHSRAT